MPFNSRVIMDNLFLAKILINTQASMIFTDGNNFSLVSDSFPQARTLSDLLDSLAPNELSVPLKNKLETTTKFLDLIEDQHIFATGCTYEWSQEKLISTHDNDSYKKIYHSDRSMFFYKGNHNNMASNNENIGLRPDSILTIPEAEIVIVFNNKGNIIGHTIGNDVTAVDIEKENPLFQMQAKFYKGSVSILPLIKLGSRLPITNIKCSVLRKGNCISETSYNTQTFNRSTSEIVNQLKKLEVTPNGGFLFLGCGASYPKNKGLIPKDTVIIQADFLPINLQNNCEYIN